MTRAGKNSATVCMRAPRSSRRPTAAAVDRRSRMRGRTGFRGVFVVLTFLVIMAREMPAASAQDTTSSAGTESADLGQFTLQRSGSSSETTNMIEIVHTTNNSNLTGVYRFPDITTPTSWVLDNWNLALLELKKRTPTLQSLDLNVVFEESVAVTTLQFKLSGDERSYGPTLVFGNGALEGLSQLQQLYVKPSTFLPRPKR